MWPLSSSSQCIYIIYIKFNYILNIFPYIKAWWRSSLDSSWGLHTLTRWLLVYIQHLYNTIPWGLRTRPVYHHATRPPTERPLTYTRNKGSRHTTSRHYYPLWGSYSGELIEGNKSLNADQIQKLGGLLTLTSPTYSTASEASYREKLFASDSFTTCLGLKIKSYLQHKAQMLLKKKKNAPHNNNKLTNLIHNFKWKILNDIRLPCQWKHLIIWLNKQL